MDSNHLYNKIPPQAIDIERTILGSMLIDKASTALCVEKINKDSFYVAANKIIFETIKQMYLESIPIDIISLSEKLKSKGQFESIGEDTYLFNISDSIATYGNIEYYCSILLDKAERRNGISILSEIIESYYNDQESKAIDISSRAIEKITSIQMNKSSSPVKLGDLLVDELYRIDAVVKSGKQPAYISTGIPPLDRKLSIMQTDYIVIAGRPSNCKSTLAGLIGRNVARAGLPVLVFYLDTSKKKEASRALFTEAKINLYEFNIGIFNKRDLPRLSLAAGPLSEIPCYFDDTPDLTPSQLYAKSQKFKYENNGLGLIIVDFLQNMKAETGHTEREKVNSISSFLHNLPKKLNCPVIALSQISRYLNESKEPPRLSNLKESGNIEQDADVVILLHYPGHYPENKNGIESENLLRLIIGKQKDGPIGSIDLSFISKITTIAEMTNNYYEESLGNDYWQDIF